MAKIAAPAKTPPRTFADSPPAGLAGKAAAVASRVAGLRADLALAHDLAHQAQVREALTRTDLTLALGEVLKTRAAAKVEADRRAAEHHFQHAVVRPLRQLGRAGRRFERLWLRLGTRGHARLIADAGVWQGDDTAQMAAYVRRGPDPTVQPAALFDQAWYVSAYPEVAATGLAPLTHYLVRGAAEGRAPHPLFDPIHYRLANAAELSRSGASPLEHFVRQGAARGRNPHPLFDIAHYVAQHPMLAPGEDPLSHYVRAGWRDGLSPSPLFDPTWYRRQMPRQAAETPPLVHYVTQGWRAGLTPHPLFDPAWYLQQHADVAQAGFEPLSHYLTSGAAEGRNPSPWFDTEHYVAARGDGLDPAVNPLADYLRGGAWAVAEARPGFPTAAYLAQSPELVAEGVTPLEHWARKAAQAKAGQAKTGQT